MTQKNKRQQAVLELIERYPVATQEELVRLLDRVGIEATQATVSRDVAELGLVRTSGPEGRYMRSPTASAKRSLSDKEEQLRRLMQDLPMRVRRAQGLAVLTTLPGSAHALAYALDAIGWPEAVGTVAGDDTIFVALPAQRGGYEQLARRLSALGAYVEAEDR